MLIDQKHRTAYATGGDILLANGAKIPLPGGFQLPTTGLFSNLLDIQQVLSALTQEQVLDACLSQSTGRR